MEAIAWPTREKNQTFNIPNPTQCPQSSVYPSTILCFGRSLFRNKTNFSIGIHLPLPLLYKYGSTFVLRAWSSSAYCLLCVALFIISTNRPPPARKQSFSLLIADFLYYPSYLIRPILRFLITSNKIAYVCQKGNLLNDFFALRRTCRGIFADVLHTYIHLYAYK